MITSQELAHIAPHYLPEPHASLLNGIVLGIPIKGTGEFYTQTIHSGLIHLVVVSGSNVSLLKSVLEYIFRFLSKPALGIFIICTLVLFLLIIGITPPVFRAVLSSSLYLLGSIAGKNTPGMYILLLTAIISLFLFPSWISSLSFYLTYLSTSGIILFAKPIPKKSKGNSLSIKVFFYLLTELKTSLAAQIFIMPLIYFYFGRVSFISIITTPIVSWTLLPILVLGNLLLACHFLLQDFATLLCIPVYWLLEVIIQVVYLFS